MTTTIELIEKANHLALETWENGEGLGGDVSLTFTRLANRLRELDKPDCVWTNDDKRVDSYITGCNKRQNVRWSPYCFNCGGAVKEST